MSELTREYLDKKLDKLATKGEVKKLATRQDIVRLETKIENEVAELARMTNNGLEEIKRDLNVKKEVEGLNKRMTRMEQALNIKH